MSDVSEVPAAVSAARNGYDAATVERARALFEESTLSRGAIAKELRISRRVLTEWQGLYGWTRHPDAPTQPPALRPEARRSRQPQPRRRRIPQHERQPERLIERLYEVYAGQLDLVEARLGRSRRGLEERDARALATLAKTLSTLMALERDDGASKPDPEAVDPDEIRARIARRLYALGQSGE